MYKFAIGEIVKVTTDLEHIYDMPNSMKEHAGEIARIFHREMDGDRNVYQLSLPGVGLSISVKK